MDDRVFFHATGISAVFELSPVIRSELALEIVVPAIDEVTARRAVRQIGAVGLSSRILPIASATEDTDVAIAFLQFGGPAVTRSPRRKIALVIVGVHRQ